MSSERQDRVPSVVEGSAKLLASSWNEGLFGAPEAKPGITNDTGRVTLALGAQVRTPGPAWHLGRSGERESEKHAQGHPSSCGSALSTPGGARGHFRFPGSCSASFLAPPRRGSHHGCSCCLPPSGGQSPPVSGLALWAPVGRKGGTACPPVGAAGTPPEGPGPSAQ